MREFLETESTILTEQVNGEKRNLSLRELRERIEGAGQVDLFAIGGCGCFADEQDPSQDPEEF